MKGLMKLFAVPALIAALGACDLTGVGGEPGRLILDLELAGASDVDRVRVRLTAPDFDADEWFELTIEGDGASGSIACEPGPNRFVEVDVYEGGVMAFTAAATVSLEPGETKTLSLTAESVYSDYLQLTGRVGSFGARDHQLDSPTDLAADGERLYVVDSFARRLKAYDLEDLEAPPVWVGDLSFLDDRTDAPYFPVTTALFPEVGLLVADPSNGRLDAFDPGDGAHRGRFALPAGLKTPGDMLYWPAAGCLFVVDTDDSELYLLDADGAARPGSRLLLDEEGRAVQSVVGLALVSSTGEEARLALTSAPEGKPGRLYFYTYRLGEGPECTGSGGGGHLERPAGIASVGGLLVVADAIQHALKLFDAEGGFVDSFGYFGDRLGSFTNPLGAFSDPDGRRLYVADRGNHRLAHFDVKAE